MGRVGYWVGFADILKSVFWDGGLLSFSSLFDFLSLDSDSLFLDSLLVVLSVVLVFLIFAPLVSRDLGGLLSFFPFRVFLAGSDLPLAAPLLLPLLKSLARASLACSAASSKSYMLLCSWASISGTSSGMWVPAFRTTSTIAGLLDLFCA